jgi:hypothetical protein
MDRQLHGTARGTVGPIGLKIPIRAPASAKKQYLTFLTTRLVFESKDENS